MDCNQQILFMKHKIINTNDDKEQIIKAMDDTFDSRKNWILISKPSLTQIIELYPKYQELPFLVKFH